MLAHCPTTQTASADGLVDLTRTGQPIGRSHFPAFAARSRAHKETELHDWRVWRKMWRDARADLARAAHVAIHRWSPDSPACA